MSEDRKSTQAVPRDDEYKGAPDGVNSQAEHTATGGSDDAAPYPNSHSDKSDDERGGFADDALARRPVVDRLSRNRSSWEPQDTSGG